MRNTEHSLKVTIKREDLLTALRSNLESHRSTVKEARATYQETLENALEEALCAVRSGKKINLHAIYNLQEVTDHSSDYERAIAMFEMATDATFVFSEEQFSAYIQDDWGWKRDFNRTVSAYKV